MLETPVCSTSRSNTAATIDTVVHYNRNRNINTSGMHLNRHDIDTVVHYNKNRNIDSNDKIIR